MAARGCPGGSHRVGYAATRAPPIRSDLTLAGGCRRVENPVASAVGSVNNREEFLMRIYLRECTLILLLTAVVGFASSSWTAETPPAAAANRPSLKQRLQDGEICRGAFLGLLVGGP